MAVVIRLARHGMKKKPHYRIVAADENFPRDGRFLEILGTFDPKNVERKAEFRADRVEYWISKGARTSTTVSQILKKNLKKAS